MNHEISAIIGIGTAVPDYRLEQDETAHRLSQALHAYPDSARWAKRLFKQCGVKTRYTCEPNLLEPSDSCRYFSLAANHLVPTTKERMAMYKQQSVPIAFRAAQKALKDSQIQSSEITHLITVSCTGQFLPGLDTLLVKELGLRETVNRIPLNFLGCAAGLKAICLSKELIQHDRHAKVLIVTVELCTLHIQPSTAREALFGASFFGDGASACVVASSMAGSRPASFELGTSHSVLLPGCAEEMVWEVGNYGFDLYLSTKIPKLIREFIPEQIERLQGSDALPSLWAIHPGGKGIIDVLEEVYSLDKEQTGPSRTILERYGNMSSATILFVLDEMRKQLINNLADKTSGIALAFGPGLTCEMIQISYIPAAASAMAELKDETYA
ncbi:type III polyketide synthase [Paenibacillus sp. IITD108]|uniref:type III polyketide synthase n=1 Tax=Paenibacillus sp. IITD108 TaxID=3116649 RepID=UPI002F41803D